MRCVEKGIRRRHGTRAGPHRIVSNMVESDGRIHPFSTRLRHSSTPLLTQHHMKARALESVLFLCLACVIGGPATRYNPGRNRRPPHVNLTAAEAADRRQQTGVSVAGDDGWCELGGAAADGTTVAVDGTSVSGYQEPGGAAGRHAGVPPPSASVVPPPHDATVIPRAPRAVTLGHDGFVKGRGWI